ncbi:MAG: tetratricopeptide repeat protein [Caulobacteraceae bacterium]|nr:tetratricopeptide repeat protein [Caulobacteraceae bacterium]
MKTFRTAALAALSCVSMLALAACATAPAGSELGAQATAPPAPGDPGTAYGLFLAGAAAFNQGDKHDAADLFAGAARQDPDAPFLQERAFTAALIAGDVHHAAQLAPPDGAADAAIVRLGRLTQAVDALAEGKGREARTALTNPPIGAPFTTAGVLLEPWAAAAAGDWKTALAVPSPRGERLVDEITRLDNAMLLEHRRRYAAADAAFRKLLSDADGSGVYTSAYGGFLERRGRRADAVALYQASLKGDASNRYMREALARVQAGKPAPAEPTLAEGAAQALLGPTVVLLSEKQPELGLAYLRLVLRLDPKRDEAWLLVGDSMVSSGDLDAAREAYSHPQPGSPDFIDARARLISTYDGDASANPAVLQLAEETVKASPGDDDALTLLADALRINERYGESAKVLDKLIVDQGAKAGWQLYYMRGVARQQAGDWPSAQADMETALKLAPDEPEILNYLAYSWVDRGERLTEAKAMIEKAVAAKPDSGAMVDSLGWVYFRMGDYPKAVNQLEHAAELDPADPDINNHLGDAYWRAGRKTEARFQWERVLTLNPDAKLREEVEGKLKSGLSPAGARVAEASATAAQ